ncbi:MAG: hypothetical protein RR585_03145 [Coprobacillus sp.]
MPNAIQLVTSILEMDKEIEFLKLKVERMSAENVNLKKPVSVCNSTNVKTQLELIVFEMGKKKLFDDIYEYYTRGVSVKRKENNDVVYTSYEDWVNNAGNDSRIPCTCSKKEVIELFDKELREEYEKKCKQAYNSLLKEEQESKEDEE